MNKPVDGAEARLRDAATSIQPVVGVATGDLSAMLAHSAALVAENERLKTAIVMIAETQRERFAFAAAHGEWCQRTARTALETRNG